jgi:hypothetical protein
MQTTIEYGYGHTKEAAKLVREALNEGLKREKPYLGLTVSVRKADSGYGGPRVEITTNNIGLDKRYEYIVNSDGSGIGDGPGVLESRPVSEFPNGRPHYNVRLVEPEMLTVVNTKIKAILSQFGKDNDDAMTDYFDNTMPLFYGVSYKEAK